MLKDWNNLKYNINNIVTPLILAGGKGTRLRSEIGDLPKCLADIKGKEFIKHILDKLIVEGFDNVVMAIGYNYDKIINALGQNYKNLKIFYSVEAEPLDTGGAVFNALRMIRTPYMLVINGDSFCDLSLRQFILKTIKGPYKRGLVAVYSDDISQYGSIKGDAEGKLMSFDEKLTQNISGWINGGIYLFSKSDFYQSKLKYELKFSLEEVFVPSLIEKGVEVFYSPGKFLDIGTPERYLLAKSFFGNYVNDGFRLAVIDRDGTIIKDKVYLKDPNNIEFIGDAENAIRLLNMHNFKVVILTNQSGIGRGLFSEDTLHSIHNRIFYYLSEKGAGIDGIYYCPHHPDENCLCRKPKTGLFYSITDDFSGFKEVYVIGDNKCDLEFAKNIKAKMFLIKNEIEFGGENHRYRDKFRSVSNIYEAVGEIIGDNIYD